MKNLIAAALVALAGPVCATDLVPTDLSELKWVARPILVFGDAAQDPRVVQQLKAFTAEQDQLDERDVVVIVDTDPGTLSDLRKRFRPRDFMVVLVGKDGQVKYRKPNPVTVREIIRLIDRTPLRQQEIEAKRAGG